MTASSPAKSMSAARQNRFLQEFEGNLVALFRRAAADHLSNDALVSAARSCALWRPERKLFSAARAAYLQGYFDALYRAHHDHALEWRAALDDVLMQGADVPSGAWHRVMPNGGHFVYRDAPDCIFS